MSIEHHTLTIGDIDVAVVRKAIKNLHLGVYPPDGRVRVAVPLSVTDAAVRVAVIGKLSWIRRQQRAFEEQPRETEREMVSGESHYYLGQRYLLEVVEAEGPARIVVRHRKLELRTRRETSASLRRRVLDAFYRERLRELVPALIEKWEAALGVKVAFFGIKRMKTKWGTCNPEARRIWLNLELAKKSLECLEYVVVHELVHLLAPRHDEHFVALMDRHLPRWRHLRSLLNATPLGNASWPAPSSR